MKKMILMLVLGVVSLAMVAQAQASILLSYNVQGSYNDDYDMLVGALDSESNTVWSQTVAWRGNGNFTETSGSLDISSNPYVWDHTWFLTAADNWGADSGSIYDFSIDADGAVYTADGLAMYIPDYQSRTVYIEMPANVVPEPMSMVLVSTGLLGLFGLRRKNS